MGIDAKMLLKVKQTEAFTPEELKLLSAKLCISLGAKHFFTNTKTGRTAITLTTGYDDNWEEVPELAGRVFLQDGPTEIATTEEWFYEVHLWTRYYGPGYERGDCLLLCSVAEWCESNIPSCTVFYGGDSSGVCAKPFDAEARQTLRNHLYSTAGRDYFNRGLSGALGSPWEDKRTLTLTPPISDCKLCVPGYEPSRNGFGGGGTTEFGQFYCAVCGRNFVTNNGGQSWSDKDNS